MVVHEGQDLLKVKVFLLALHAQVVQGKMNHVHPAGAAKASRSVSSEQPTLRPAKGLWPRAQHNYSSSVPRDPTAALRSGAQGCASPRTDTHCCSFLPSSSHALLLRSSTRAGWLLLTCRLFTKQSLLLDFTLASPKVKAKQHVLQNFPSPAPSAALCNTPVQLALLGYFTKCFQIIKVHYKVPQKLIFNLKT